MDNSVEIVPAPQFVINIVQGVDGEDSGFAVLAGTTSFVVKVMASVGGGASGEEYTQAEKDKLAAIEPLAKDDLTGGEIKTLYELESDTNAYTDVEKSKLAAIEAGATADQTNTEIRTAVGAATDSNVFTDLHIDKLNNIQAFATGDQTDAEIRTAVEAAADSNVFTDADHSKLNAIEAGATTDQSDSEIETAYNAQVAKVSGPEITAGTEILVRRVSPADIKAFVLAHETGGSGATPADIVALSSFTPTLTDIFRGVDDPAGTPVFRKNTYAAIRTLVEANLVSPIIKAGTSGLGSFNVNADDLIIENNAAGGMTIAVPNTANAQIFFADSDDDNVGKIIYNHALDLMQFVVNTKISLTIDSASRILTGTAVPDLVGITAGSMTISTGNSGVTSLGTGADDFIIESSGNAGMTIASPNTGTCTINFADPENNADGKINYQHVSGKMSFTTRGAVAVSIDEVGDLLLDNRLGWGTDLFLERHSANSLAQRNGTNEQTFYVYNTYTNDSNYERAFFKFASNVVRIGMDAAGTGVQRGMFLKRATGKTIIFGSTTAIGWNVDANDNFVPLVDATHDLGLSNKRVRDIRASGTIIVGQTVDNDIAFKVTGHSLTAAAATAMIDLSGTWNTTGSPTGIKLNIVNTASNDLSKLIELEVGGSDRFKVFVSGRISAALGIDNTVALTLAGYNLTGSGSNSLADLTGTLNTTGAPTIFKMDITDTASSASTLLMDLKVGGVSMFSVSKAGHITAVSGLGGAPAQVSAQEMIDGTEVALRSFSPDNVENMITIHGGGGSGGATPADHVALTPFTPVLTDISRGVDDPAGTPVFGKVTYADIRTLIEANLVDPRISGKLITGGSALVGPDAGSVTISTGASGVTAINSKGDELILENNGAVGMTFASPNNADSGIFWADPESPQSGRIMYQHATDIMKFDAGGTMAFVIDSTGRIITKSTAVDFLGVGGSITIHTGNSGVSSVFAGAAGLLIEHTGDTGISIATRNTDAASIVFADPENNAIGKLVYDHADNSMRFTVAGNDLFHLTTGLVEQRNGTNAQEFRIYNTEDTSLTNFERLKIAWESNVLAIGTENAGTGSARAMNFQTNGILALTIDTTQRILTGLAVTDLVGGKPGSVTISTGNSQLTSANVNADDLILENNSACGITIVSPNNTNCQIFFADPEDDNVGRLRYDHSVNAFSIFVDAALALTIDSSQRLLTGTSVSDVVGSKSGSMTISTGNSGVTSLNSSADDLTIEGSSNAGMTIATPNTATGFIHFTDPETAGVGQILYDHSISQMAFAVSGVKNLFLSSNIMELRRGTTAQNSHVYNTWTDESNYERFTTKWSANTLVMQTEAAGTGSNRSIQLIAKGATLNFGAENALQWVVTSGALQPANNNAETLGIDSLRIKKIFLSNQVDIVQQTANFNAIAISGHTINGSSAVSMIDLAGTWNTTGAPTAIKLDILDTASDAASLLIDLKVGGVSMFSVSKAGEVTAVSGLGGSGTSPTRTTINLSASSTKVSVPAGVTWFRFQSELITVSDASGGSPRIGMEHTGTTDQTWTGYEQQLGSSGFAVNLVAANVAFIATGFEGAGTSRSFSGTVWSPRDATKKTLTSCFGVAHGEPSQRNRNMKADLAKDDATIVFDINNGTQSGTVEIEWFYS